MENQATFWYVRVCSFGQLTPTKTSPGELASLQMRRANLSYQLTHTQGRIEDCEKHIVTLQEKFTSKVRVLEVLKESSRYVKMPPASPYGNKKRAREEKPTEEAPEGEIDAVDVSDKK